MGLSLPENPNLAEATARIPHPICGIVLEWTSARNWNGMNSVLL